MAWNPSWIRSLPRVVFAVVLNTCLPFVSCLRAVSVCGCCARCRCVPSMALDDCSCRMSLPPFLHPYPVSSCIHHHPPHHHFHHRLNVVSLSPVPVSMSVSTIRKPSCVHIACRRPFPPWACVHPLSPSPSPLSNFGPSVPVPVFVCVQSFWFEALVLSTSYSVFAARSSQFAVIIRYRYLCIMYRKYRESSTLQYIALANSALRVAALCVVLL